MTDLSPIPPSILAPTDAGWVEALTGDELPEPAKRWRIDGTGSAAWAMAHVINSGAQLEALTAQAVEWYGRIDAWLVHESAPPRATAAFFAAHLERFALDTREADPRKKSVTLPGGKVQTREAKPRAVVIDEAEALAWAAKNAPEAIQTTEKLRLEALRLRLTVKEMVTIAWVTNSCGCKVSVRDEEGLDIPPVGTETECSTCGADALIGMVEVLHSRWVVTDAEGGDVPGVDVDPGGVTAKVVVG